MCEANNTADDQPVDLELIEREALARDEFWAADDDERWRELMVQSSAEWEQRALRNLTLPVGDWLRASG